MSASSIFRVAVICLFVTPLALCAADPATAPATAPTMAEAAPATVPATQAAARTTQDIFATLQNAERQLHDAAPDLQDIFDASKRAALAPKVIGPMKTLVSGFDELAAVSPAMKQRAEANKISLQAMLVFLEDPDTTAAVQEAAKGTDPTAAASARSALLLCRWWGSIKDAAAQGKVVDDLEAMAKADPTQDMLTVAGIMMSQFGAASPDLEDRVKKVLSQDLTGELAKRVAAEMAVEDQQAAAEKAAAEKLKALEGKPMVLAGPTQDGKQLTTADWKGKVILVDFWATWCPPCREELPRVEKAYSDFHAKGLEVLGVSCDHSPEDLAKFLADNKEMPWPQLFDAKNPGPHALVTQFGITGIPTMFLIDKKGVLRSTSAREDFETLIPQLLAEKAE